MDRKCHRPLLWVGEDARSKKCGLNGLALESWKSARDQNVSQTSALGWGGFKEVKGRLNSMGTRILKVCERSECVADHCIG